MLFAALPTLLLRLAFPIQENVEQQKYNSDGLTYGGGMGEDKPSKEGVDRMAKVCLSHH